ncbi:MAG: hypothetical protein DMG51_08015 [Acidobacteria bacterium]|nr:MAG: hypothetical protein DMG51_08015 [Acidobacteriota bacterium]
MPDRFCIEHLFILYAVQPRLVPKSSRLVHVAQFRLVLFYGRFKESIVTALQWLGAISNGSGERFRG